MALTEEEALLFLCHLGDGTTGWEVEPETVEKINAIQRRCGVHGDCHGMDNPTIAELQEEINERS